MFIEKLIDLCTEFLDFHFGTHLALVLHCKRSQQ